MADPAPPTIEQMLQQTREGLGDAIAVARTVANDIAVRRSEQIRTKVEITAKQDQEELPILQRATAILRDAATALTEMRGKPK